MQQKVKNAFEHGPATSLATQEGKWLSWEDGNL